LREWALQANVLMEEVDVLYYCDMAAKNGSGPEPKNHTASL
jgi:hypothetical protein